MASTMQTPAANRRCFAMNTPPMLNTPGSIAGIACGSGPKIAHEAERIAKLAPMPTMKQFRMSYCSGLNSSFWHSTAMAAAIGDSDRDRQPHRQSLVDADVPDGEGRQHHQFAVDEVDHAHDAEQQGDPQRDQHIDQAGHQAAEDDLQKQGRCQRGKPPARRAVTTTGPDVWLPATKPLPAIR